MNAFIIGRIRSLKFAIKGFFLLIRTEHSIISQLMVGGVFVGLGFYFGISKTEWILQTLSIGLVLTTESLNTGIEKVCDFIHPDYHERIGFIKDISAGAVSFAVFTAIINASIIYSSYILAAYHHMGH